MKKIIVFAVFFAFILSLSFRYLDDRDDFELVKNLEIYHNVFKQLHYNYVNKIDSRALITTSIDKMLEQLDPYTVYYPESEIESLKMISNSQYNGIGISIDSIDRHFFITDVVKSGTADKKGLKIGDIISSINGTSVKDMSFQTIHRLITGPLGVSVRLKILRGNSSLSFSIPRQVIDVHVVSLAKKIKDFGYIKLENFSDRAFSEFKTAYFELKRQKIKGLIIDLRDNPGGLLGQAVKILNLFIPKNKVVVVSRGKSENSNSTFITSQDADDTRIPIVVLVNSNSASASEIVAGTLQDYDRGVILGENTYGKGLVQQIFDLGYNSKIKITVSKYYIPSGRCIQAIDYSHNKNNNIDKTKKFYTSRHRVVYEGAGIRPDVYIRSDTLDDAIKTLFNKYIIFKFSNYYFNNSDTSLMKLPEKIYYNDFDSFWNYLIRNNYLQYLSEIKEVADIEAKSKNDPDVLNQLHILKKSITLMIKKEILKHKEQLNVLISQQLVKLKFYSKGQILFNINHDKDILKAEEILSQKKEYNKLLNR